MHIWDQGTVGRKVFSKYLGYKSTLSFKRHQCIGFLIAAHWERMSIGQNSGWHNTDCTLLALI